MIDLFVTDGDFTGLKGYLSNNGNLVEVSNDDTKLFFTKKDGTMKVVDLTRPAIQVGRDIASLKSSALAAAYTNKSKASKDNTINPKALEFRSARFNVSTKFKTGAAKRLEGTVVGSGQFAETKGFTDQEYLNQIKLEAKGILKPSSITYNQKGELIYTTPGTTVGTVLGRKGDHVQIIERLEEAAAADVKNEVTSDDDTNQAPI
jgi:hypothetical protein